MANFCLINRLNPFFLSRWGKYDANFEAHVAQMYNVRLGQLIDFSVNCNALLQHLQDVREAKEEMMHELE